MGWTEKHIIGIRDKRKKCISCFNLVLNLRGHGHCSNCYNLEMSRFTQAKSKGETSHTTFGNWMREKNGLSTTVMKDIPEGQKIVKKKPKKRTQSQKWVDKLDSVFSVYIRLRDTSRKGYGQSCDGMGMIWYYVEPSGKIVTNCDNGHYVGREFWYGRYNEKNCYAQLQYTNRFKEGMKVATKAKMVKIHGEDTVQELERNCKLYNKRPPVLALQAAYSLYEKKVAELLATKDWWNEQRTQKSLYR